MENIAFAILIGIAIGWKAAHFSIAEDCKKLGKFFVGKTVYECSAIQSTNQKVVD